MFEIFGLLRVLGVLGSWGSWSLASLGGLGNLGGLGVGALGVLGVLDVLGGPGLQGRGSGSWACGRLWGPGLIRIRKDQANRHKNMLQIKLETCRWHRDTPRQDDPSSKTGCGNGADAETN